MNNKLVIKLSNGKELVAELYNYDGEHPEISVCVCEDGTPIQDICLVRPHEKTPYDIGDQSTDIDCLVWDDEYDEDYTCKFVIPQYDEQKEC